jgi:hypothetical protein
MAGKRKTLAEFAAERPGGTGSVPWITTIPEFEECVAAFQAGVRQAIIRHWLRDECGYGTKATENTVDGYLRRHGTETVS